MGTAGCGRGRLRVMLALQIALLAFPDPLGQFFTWFTKSEGVAALHRKHVEGNQVLHMLKDTPMAAAPDSLKLDFARGPAGRAVAQFMRAEQEYIGDWKIERIIEAAGEGFDASAERNRLVEQAASHPVVLFSFVDCPWCLLAKERFQAIEASEAEAWLPPGSIKVVELEDLGRNGKNLRAAIALATGRTSMPSIFVGGRCIGGFTDGDPQGDDELCHRGAQGLEPLTERGTQDLQRLLDGTRWNLQ